MGNTKAITAIAFCIFIGVLVALAGGQGSLPFTSNLTLFAACAAVGFLLHWLVFIPSFVFQSERYFDLTGSASFITATALAWAYNPTMDQRTFLMSGLIIIWALRLGSFLFLRIRQAGFDRRFNELKTRFWRFAFTWTLGGLWVFLTMAAPLAAMTSSNKIALDWFAYAGLILWVAGFVTEVVADRQKSNFRNKPENENKFITHGLWAWSRHPNYFGEILLWLGLAIIAFPVLAGWQLITLISPLFVTLLLTRVSGIPLLEKKAEEKWGSEPEYLAYKHKTPVLIPWPPKSGKN